jgi:hypothetical protein
MVAYSLAWVAGVRAHSGREAAADGTITILGQTRKPLLFWPRRELNTQHTPNSFRRPSRLSENKSRSANAYASFRRHFASAKLHSCAGVALAS